MVLVCGSRSAREQLLSFRRVEKEEVGGEIRGLQRSCHHRHNSLDSEYVRRYLSLFYIKLSLRPPYCNCFYLPTANANAM
jgi:hypothetical protein